MNYATGLALRNYLSVHDTKNNFWLFERPFKIQRNDVFLFEISFFVIEILSFFLLCKLHQ